MDDGRDKKNPKPLNATAFSTLVKTAHEVRRRHQQHVHALLHRKVIVSSGDGEIVVPLDISSRMSCLPRCWPRDRRWSQTLRRKRKFASTRRSN